jgi:hypothetical protein
MSEDGEKITALPKSHVAPRSGLNLLLSTVLDTATCFEPVKHCPGA